MQQTKKTYGKPFLFLALLTITTLLLFLLIGLNLSKTSTLVYALNRRIKVIGAILVVGYAVSHSTIVFQTITNNEILTPGVMGLDSLYIFIQTLVLFLLGGSGLALMTGGKNFIISLVLMVGMSLILFWAMFRGEGQNVYFLVLIGMVFGTFFGGLANFMQVLIDPNEYDILLGKMFASFSRVNVDLLFLSAVITIIVAVLSIPDYRKLDVLAMGKSHAINLGLNYNRMVLKSLISISILVSVSTILVGPITFLGILVASLGRRLFKTYRHTILIAGTTLISLSMLFLGMVLTERFFKFSTPLSVILNFVGGIYFIFMLLRQSHNERR